MRGCSQERIILLAKKAGIRDGTLCRWKLQAEIDTGIKTRVKSYESDELKQARRKIADLEAEPKLTQDACDLFNVEVVDSMLRLTDW